MPSRRPKRCSRAVSILQSLQSWRVLTMCTLKSVSVLCVFPHPVNQVIHVYPYDDLQHRTRVRTAMAQDAERNAMPGGGEFVVAQEAEIMNPAPFMRSLGSRDYGTGNVYEMRTYTYAPGDIPKVLEGWAKAIEAREKF